MKIELRRIFTLSILSLLLALLVITDSCVYITGEAITVSAPAVAAVKDITPEDANLKMMASSKWIDIIDVRTPQEYAAGHLERAVNIDFNAPDFKEKVAELNRDVTYIVYCRTGVRSAAASKVMAELGFKDIYNMTGGFSAWEVAGLPVTP